MEDYYDILGVNKNANKSEIESAFRKKARLLHPDINKAKDAEQKFQDLSMAYNTLKDDKKRKEYDYSKIYNTQNYNNYQQNATQYTNFDHINIDIDDLFFRQKQKSSDNAYYNNNNDDFIDSIFDIFQVNKKRNINSSINYNIKIDISYSDYDIMYQPEKEISYIQNLRCSTCNGKKTYSINICTKCNGNKYTYIQPSPNIYIKQNCQYCRGTGHQYKTCTSCDNGFNKTHNLYKQDLLYDGYSKNITIPKYGHQAINYENDGNLIINVLLAKNNILNIYKKDIYITIPITMDESISGLNFNMFIPNRGNFNINIPKNIKEDDKITIKNAGIKTKDYIGSFYINVQIFKNNQSDIENIILQERNNILKKLQNIS